MRKQLIIAPLEEITIAGIAKKGKEICCCMQNPLLSNNSVNNARC
jgi:hypothetical protein